LWLAGSSRRAIERGPKQHLSANATTQATAQNTGAPYVYEYNLTIEQQLTKSFALRFGYLGNDTHKNIIMIDDNAPVFFPNAANSTAGIDCRRPHEPYRTSGGPANTTTCTYRGYSGSGADQYLSVQGVSRSTKLCLPSRSVPVSRIAQGLHMVRIGHMVIERPTPIQLHGVGVCVLVRTRGRSERSPPCGLEDHARSSERPSPLP
jgi:hypothetical protein